MSPYYPLTEWPILMCLGIFVVLIAALAYGVMMTRHIELVPAPASDRAGAAEDA